MQILCDRAILEGRSRGSLLESDEQLPAHRQSYFLLTALPTQTPPTPMWRILIGREATPPPLDPLSIGPHICDRENPVQKIPCKKNNFVLALA